MRQPSFARQFAGVGQLVLARDLADGERSYPVELLRLVVAE